MTTTIVEESTQADISYARKTTRDTFLRLARFFSVRVVMQIITIVIGIYLTILIANMGGYVDTILKAEIQETVNAEIAALAAQQPMSPEARAQLIASEIAEREHLAGLDQPFFPRSLRHLRNALTLQFGRARTMVSDHGSRQVKNIILERLPATLLLMGFSQVILFFVSLFLALNLSRHYGSVWDKLVVGLSPTSSIPAWFYGIFLILIFAAWLRILPFDGMVDAPPPATKLGYFLSVLRHLILPAGSLFVSGFFINIYTWRTFFLIYSSEDYVEMAKAKGLNSRDVERRYILRPTLPNIITRFALMLIGIWMGAILTETVFLWPGLGRVIFEAIQRYDTAVIVGTTIVYAYLLAFTVFFLDFIYAIVDPRVKIGGGSN